MREDREAYLPQSADARPACASARCPLVLVCGVVGAVLVVTKCMTGVLVILLYPRAGDRYVFVR
jgi:hypothetical protein